MVMPAKRRGHSLVQSVGLEPLPAFAQLSLCIVSVLRSLDRRGGSEGHPLRPQLSKCALKGLRAMFYSSDKE